MKSAPFIIYALVDPFTKGIRYIGKSSRGVLRAQAHCQPSRLKKDGSHKGNWLRGLVAVGAEYRIETLEVVDSLALLDAAEIRWIAHGLAAGWPLTNLTPGGDGWTGPMTEVVKAKISEACRRPDRVAKMSAANKGKIVSDETRRRQSEAHKGAIVSAETRAKQSAVRKGKKRSPEFCALMSRLKTGVPRPDLSAWNKSAAGIAHRAQAVEAARTAGRPGLVERNKSPAQAAAVSRALKGRPFSELHRERMSAAWDIRRAREQAAKSNKKPT